MTTPTLSAGQKQAADFASLLRARNSLIWIVTPEEARVEGYLVEAATSIKYVPRFWDIAAGVTNLKGAKDNTLGQSDMTDPGSVLAAIRERSENEKTKERNIWVMRDLTTLLDGPIGIGTRRLLRNLARSLPGQNSERAQAIVIISPNGNVPEELAGHVTVIEWSRPDRTELTAIFDAAINSLPEYETDPETRMPDPNKPLRSLAAPGTVRDEAISASIGLTGEEAASCFARSLVTTRKIDPKIISDEKKRVITREKVLTWYDPIPGGLDAVGGLENLKAWLKTRKNAYSPEARAYGLPAPKGIGLVGITGCGKSLSAKAVSTEWNVPLLRLDLGALKDKFMGASEGNLRKALKVIEAIGRCVVWIDEIEKAMAGSSGGAADGGVAADQLGYLLSWMQERKTEAFIIATANDITSLPPELFRKGRFDEVWAIDLPNSEERKAVLGAALREYKRGDLKVNYEEIANACDGFTGAEIAEIVPSAMHIAFEQDAREITTADLLEAARHVAPISVTQEDKITALRKWARDNGTRPATAAHKEATVSASQARALDLDPAA